MKESNTYGNKVHKENYAHLKKTSIYGTKYPFDVAMQEIEQKTFTFGNMFLQCIQIS